MKIEQIVLKNFKRFTKLTIKDIPETAKLVLLVGPNGSGKSSVFEAFNHWHRTQGYRLGHSDDEKVFYMKDVHLSSDRWYSENVSLKLHHITNLN